MNATWIVTVFEVIDIIMEGLDHHSQVLTTVSAAGSESGSPNGARLAA